MKFRNCLIRFGFAFLGAVTPVTAELVVNGSFEAVGDDPAASMDFPYPTPDDWSYGGESLGFTEPERLLGAINENFRGGGTIPETPHGENWLLVDSRIETFYIFQALGPISVGEQFTLSALIGRQIGVEIAGIELALCRSVEGSETPDEVLAAIDNTDPGIAALEPVSSVQTSVEYVATEEDAGETLFVRIGQVPDWPSSPVTQVIVDEVSVTTGDSGIPRIIEVTVDSENQEAVISWESQPDRSYAVEVSTNLREQPPAPEAPDPGAWTEIADGVSSDGELTQFTDSLPPVGGARRFYRVRLEE